MLEKSGVPVFAGRYRFEPVNDSGDESQSRFAQVVYDLKTEKMGVIKRAETTSERAVRRLNHEVEVLRILKGLGVPELYDTGESEYDSVNYFYTVTEVAGGSSIEENLESLTASERIEILTEFFGVLAKVHQRGIVNNHIHLRHLYWDKKKKKLTIVNWEHARYGVDAEQKTEFADDLVSSAAILFALATRPGAARLLKSFALPDETGLFPDLPKLPIEFRNICFWAPRAGAAGPPYHTASELFHASKRWNDPTYGKQPVLTHPQVPGRFNLNRQFAISFSVLALFLIFTFLVGRNMLRTVFAFKMLASTEMSQSAASAPLGVNARFIPTSIPTEEQTQTVEPTSIPAGTRSPRTYAEPLLKFDQNSTLNDCWQNETNLTTNLWTLEGFTRRRDAYWRFGLEKNRTVEQWIQSDFSRCLDTGKIGAIALNAWVVQLELERKSSANASILEPGKEFGFFIEDANGRKREYTLWVDKDLALHVRLREDDRITYDEIVPIVKKENFKVAQIYPRLYANFPIQIFFEIDNQGLDILYLQEGPVQLPMEAKDMNPSQMVQIDGVMLPALGDIAKFGLIGYGGETQSVIWPLVFFVE